jgi:hypothetical protein
VTAPAWPLKRHPEHGYRLNPDPLLGVRGELQGRAPGKAAVLRLRRLALGVADTIFTDVSEFQRSSYTDAYPHQFASFRANDGTYADRKCSANLSWCRAAASSGRLAGFMVYAVWRPNWQQTLDTLKAVVGTPHPRMAIMWDVESWGGDLIGDHSGAINATREATIAWLGGNRARVIGYGNGGDLASLWPTRGDAKIILANYSANPAYPGKIAHQYTSSGSVAPFGAPVDINSADGYTPAAFAAALGLTGAAPTPSPTPTPGPPITAGDTSAMFTIRITVDAHGKKIASPPIYLMAPGHVEHLDATAWSVFKRVLPHAGDVNQLQFDRAKAALL